MNDKLSAFRKVKKRTVRDNYGFLIQVCASLSTMSCVLLTVLMKGIETVARSIDC